MGKFSKILDAVKNANKESDALKILDNAMDISEDGIVRGVSNPKDIDKLIELRRKSAIKVNTNQPEIKIVPRKDTEFLPEPSEQESQKRYIDWLKDNNPELAEQKIKEIQESLDKTKVSAFAPVAGLSLNPVDNLKKGYEGFENMREKLSDYLAKQTTGYLPEASKDTAEKQAKQVMNAATDPLNYVGGVGVVDAGLATVDALPEGSLKRFKGILGK